MKKIGDQLAALITQNPENSYAVIIVCSFNDKLEKFVLNRIMDTIYSGKLSGNEIKEMELLDEVLSIELDAKITL